jgi:cyclopropane-fatty-acyl-phospholipid synthase|tara:strand:- start:1282 stop:2133 length:852 start_codon:yes stop_codon:yes gene_type:complete
VIFQSKLYEGEITHARTKPVKHNFSFPIYTFVLDLDELELLDKEIRFFGYNRGSVFTLYDSDYLGSGEESIKEKLKNWLTKFGYEEKYSTVKMITTLRVFKHTFNPVIFYYCLDSENNIVYHVAEVHNTFGEGHLYILKDGKKSKVGTEYLVPKEFHVSPFNKVEGDYNFHFSELKKKLDVRINVSKDNENFFYARISGNVQKITKYKLIKLIMKYPIRTLLVIPKILAEAAKLYYLKNLEIIDKPDPSSERTYKATYPAYISDFQTSEDADGIGRWFFSKIY